jgi:hypothetical protein
MDLNTNIEDQFPGKKLVYINGKYILKDKTKPRSSGKGKKRYEYLQEEKIAQMEAEASRKGKIYIPYDAISSKNSMEFVYVYSQKEGRKVPKLLHSSQYETYVKLTKTYWIKNKMFFLSLIRKLETPYRVGFYFIRSTRQRFDYANMVQGVQDLMVTHEWLPDDRMDILIPMMDGYHVDKLRQGTIITVHNT